MDYLEQMIADYIRSMPPDELWLTTKQVAASLGVCVSTLEKWRAAGKGPPFKRKGRRLLRYNSADLNAWMKTTAWTAA